jgi:hypothetical protein
LEGHKWRRAPDTRADGSNGGRVVRYEHANDAPSAGLSRKATTNRLGVSLYVRRLEGSVKGGRA